MSAPRVRALDGLRAIAVALVFLVHAPAALGGSYGTVIGRWARQGHLGVDVFFVLSGYLITRVLLRERRDPRGLTRFLARRAARILPPYAVYLTVLVVLARHTRLLANPASYAPRDDLVFFVTFLGNVPSALARDPGHLLAPLWSLAIEEQFYLVWPLAVRALAPRHCAALALFGVFTAALLRAGYFASIGPERLYYATPTRIDALFVGALLAHGLAHPTLAPRIARAAPQLIAPAAFVIALALATPGGHQLSPHRDFFTLGPTLVSVAIAVALANILLTSTASTPAPTAAPPSNTEGPLSRLLATRPLVALGRVSYGMYLSHMLVGLLVAPWLTAGPLELRLLVWIAATAALATLHFHLVERPLIALAHRVR